jgi:mRNA-degrading endonuclease RelE of RelBE toxin-antitoxin system
MDVRFHCSKRVRHSAKKAKHEVFDACPIVCQALRLNPFFGVSIPRFHHLRKMRLRVPGFNVGKSGGYRLVYRAKEMDQAIYVVFLETYSKGDCEDLSHIEYKTLQAEAEIILFQPLLHDWE